MAQVTWELDAQERADLLAQLARSAIAMYFAPETYAPITLLELGLFAASGKLLVCCPPGYWRKGNVDVVCARYGIPQAPDAQRAVRRDRRLVGPAPGAYASVAVSLCWLML